VIAPDLKENLAKSDGFATNLIKQINEYILKNTLNLPPEEVNILNEGYRVHEILSLDLFKERVSTIIWSIGYTRDYSLVQLPFLDAYGYPSTNRGVTSHPGLYFLGLPWMNTFRSGFLLGVGESAQYIADVICIE